jgi:hypothetical protein
MVMTGDCFRQVPVGCRSPSPEQQLGGHGVATDAQVVTSCDSKEEEEEEEEGAKYQADTRAVPSSSAAAGRGGAGGTLLPAAATAAAEGSLAGFLPVTTDQAKQRRALHRLLIELQVGAGSVGGEVHHARQTNTAILQLCRESYHAFCVVETRVFSSLARSRSVHWLQQCTRPHLLDTTPDTD